MAKPFSSADRLHQGNRLRETFLAALNQTMAAIAGQVQQRLSQLIDEPCPSREVQFRRDAWMAFKSAGPRWVQQTQTEWRVFLPSAGATSLTASGRAPLSDGMFELLGTDVVENNILASRLVLAVNDRLMSELDDLRVRLRLLEGHDDLQERDILRPDVWAQVLVEQWPLAGMEADAWPLISEVVQDLLIRNLREAYQAANASLVALGILPVIELKDRVRIQRPASSASARPVEPPSHPSALEEPSGPAGLSAAPTSTPAPAPRPAPSPAAAFAPPSASGASAPGAAAQASPAPGAASAADAGEASRPRSSGGFFSGRLGWFSGNDAAAANRSAGPGSVAPESWSGAAGAEAGGNGGSEETRLLTHITPLARARVRAQGVLGQLKRIFVSQAAADFASTEFHRPSPALTQALAPETLAARHAGGDTLFQDYSPAGVARVASDLRAQTVELKQKAETKSEKAIIEIVALMFQSILAEERIPPGIRVWFARLQMPVLRVALEDPEFLSTTDHPARMLIDRMGSCVMGFDSAGVQSAAMEGEIRRVVRVVEQYPETGKKVYKIVYEEFQKFLAKFLTEKGATQKVVSVAQQVEQKETMAIQFTIELREMLRDLPVREEIRDYLFKVWAEVLAVSALRKGAKHADTLTLKKCASELVWAASAKPNRADRNRVIQELPNLLLRLRAGMSLLAMPPSEQEAHVKSISDTLADAFMSKTQAIPQAKIEAMAERLSNLEDFVSDDVMGDLPLDSESLEMMLGIEASAIEVVSAGGIKPTAAMLAWASELQLGSWFTLDHNNQITQVQFAWRSERKQLHLFAATSGKSYLIQAGRLAAYLQAGLLLPQEEEALTVRATRDALAKIEANPERLLN